MKNKIIISFSLFLFITNVPPVRVFLEIFFGSPYYYTTKSGAFRDEEIITQGAEYKHVIRAYNQYRRNFNASEDTLYRTFKMKPQKFWLWGQFLLHPKYRLPYLEEKSDSDDHRRKVLGIYKNQNDLMVEVNGSSR